MKRLLSNKLFIISCLTLFWLCSCGERKADQPKEDELAISEQEMERQWQFEALYVEDVDTLGKVLERAFNQGDFESIHPVRVLPRDILDRALMESEDHESLQEVSESELRKLRKNAAYHGMQLDSVLSNQFNHLLGRYSAMEIDTLNYLGYNVGMSDTRGIFTATGIYFYFLESNLDSIYVRGAITESSNGIRLLALGDDFYYPSNN